MPKKSNRNQGKDTKEKIIEVTKKLFAKKGFDATSVDEIAHKIKIPKSLIYYYFRSKKDILKAIFKEFEDSLLEVKKKSFELLFDEKMENCLEERIKAIFYEITLPFVESYQDVIKIALTEEIKNFSKGPLFKYFDVNLSMVKDFLEKFNLSLNFSKEKVTILFFTLFLSLIGYSIFIDEWCTHYNIEKEKVKSLLVETLTHEYKRLGMVDFN